jgi:hypothetical protein
MTSTWSPGGVAEAVVHLLEAVEVDEEEGSAAVESLGCEYPVGLLAEVDTVGERGHRIVHRHRVDVGEVGADLVEQALDGGCERRQLALHELRGRRDEVTAPDGEQPVDERRDGAGVGAVRPLGGGSDDEQREHSDDERGGDLLVDPAEHQEAKHRQHEGREAGDHRQEPVAEIVGSRGHSRPGASMPLPHPHAGARQGRFYGTRGYRFVSATRLRRSTM